MIEIINGNIFDGNDDIICHQVNNHGVMGAEIALQIKERFPDVYAVYGEKCREFSKYHINPLGHVLYCRTKYSNVVIANIVSIFFGEKFSLNNNMFEFNKIFSLLYRINSI